MPDGPLDDSKYVTGGCCLSESDPMTTCIECGWEGDYKNHGELFEFQTLGKELNLGRNEKEHTFRSNCLMVNSL